MDAARALKDKLTGSSPTSSPRQSSDDSRPTEFDGTGKKHRLLIAAGPSYAAHSQIPIPVNSTSPIIIHSPSMLVMLHIRIKDFSGLPSKGSRQTSPYFDSETRKKDLYSISFSFIPKRDIASRDMVWGNDFDHPVKKYLPPGFNYAFKIVKEFIDPGLSCDAYADTPWVFGPALSCWFTLRLGEKKDVPEDLEGMKDGDCREWKGEEEHEEAKRNRVQLLKRREEVYAGPPVEGETIKKWLTLFPDTLQNGDIAIEEGYDGSSAQTIREQAGLPEDNQKRRKFFLKEENRDGFVFEKGRLYSADFFNQYIDFNGKLILPGFKLNVLKYAGDKTHTLRYVCKDKGTGEIFFCTTFSMLFNDDVTEAERIEAELDQKAG